MANKIIRITPSTNLNRPFRVTGSCIVVRSGGWPTHRIHWVAPTSQTALEEGSEQIVNGRAYLHPGGRFEEFWITCETTQRTVETIVLEVLDKVQPVVLQNAKRGWVEHQLLASSDVTVINSAAGATTLLYADQAWAPSTLLLDNARRFTWPSRYLTGGAAGDQPFTIRAYARITSQNATPLAPYLEWVCDQLDPVNANYGCCFQYGGRPNYRTGAANTNVPSQDPAFPIYGLSIFVTVGGAPLTAFNFLVAAASKP